MLKLLTHVTYDSLPGAAASEIRAITSRNELVSLSFSLFSTSDAELTLELSPFEGPRRTLLHGDMHVVHRWMQSGIGVFQATAMEVDELLLKDSNPDFRDAYRRRCGSLTHIHRSATRYAPPDIRLTGPVKSSISSAKARQFWISVAVPREASPGEYCATVRVRNDAGAPMEFPVVLEVLPIVLEEAPQDLMIWYRGTLNCHHPHHYVPRQIFTRQLADIHRHGFRSISLWETDAVLMQQAVDIANAAGFSGNVVLDGYREDVWSNVDFGKLTPVVYVSDEPESYSADQFHTHVSRFRQAREKQLPAMASLLQWNTRQRFATNGEEREPEIVSVFAPTNLVELTTREQRSEADGSRTYFYWHAHMEKPLVHRLLAGMFLWKSGADGISPYCYQHLPGVPYSPFNDFDSWDPRAHATTEAPSFRDHFATYPSRRGVIPTIQWKGMADGLIDLRYLVTLDTALARAEQSGDAGLIAKALRIRSTGLPLSERIPWEDLDILSDTSAVPCPGISAADFNSMRSDVARNILELQEN